MANSTELIIRNGQKFLENRRTVVLGISPGSSYFHKVETLEKLLSLGEKKADKVLIFIPDVISVHNYKALGSRNPEKAARLKYNKWGNKVKAVMKGMGCNEEKYSFIKWMDEVESSPAYVETLQTIMDLYRQNDMFHCDVQETTKGALTGINKHRGHVPEDNIDLEEGTKYLLKELALLVALHKIYPDCEEYVFVYHTPWPILEKYCSGVYDGIVKPHHVGFLVFN